tara:strand:- start:14765 stop:15364 length:600 start_codon:yes stop_codon:yes gene_type:complete
MNEVDDKHENALPLSEEWESINQWRRAKRESLVRSRIKVGSNQRKMNLEKIRLRLAEVLETLNKGIIGFYWPIKGEFDLRSFVEGYLAEEWSAALPAVVEKDEPLEFRLWTPETELLPGIWNIPTPIERNVVEPTVLLVPLVGFDAEQYRLGYGGGYYDRTIVNFKKRPFTVGVGLNIMRLKTIYPQTHDIPMDKILTV